MSSGVRRGASAETFRFDHVNGVAGSERVDLVMNVGELEVELVLGDETDVRGWKNILAAQKRVAGVSHRFGVEHGDHLTDSWMAGHSDRWKQSALKQAESHLRCQLLPSFGHLRLDRITPTDVQARFDRCSDNSPGNANKALVLIRRIMNRAVSSSLVAANPARRTRMNPRPRLTRFLSVEEIACLHEVLERCVEERPASAVQAHMMLLLLLIGCRKGEIKDLRWF